MTEISELVRKTALFGIGAVALSQEKIEAFVNDLIEKGELNRDEGKKFVNDILEEKGKQCKDLEEKIKDKLRNTMENKGMATKLDVEVLSERTDNLSDRIDKIEEALQKLKNI